MGVATMFTYLIGFLAAEARQFHMSALTEASVRIISAKRKKGEAQTVKLRAWSASAPVPHWRRLLRAQLKGSVYCRFGRAGVAFQ
jgi:hypothetical protein